MARIEAMATELDEIKEDTSLLKEDHTALKKASGIDASTSAVRKARWMAVAKIAGLLTLAVPGLIALLGGGG
jgi:hypothetical protein